MQSEIPNGILIYRGHNSQNLPIQILVYGQQVSPYSNVHWTVWGEKFD